jgi:cell division protein FtsN
MTKDYTSKNRSPQRNKTSTKPRSNRRQTIVPNRAPTWAWVLIGLLVATLVTFLFFLANKSDTLSVSNKKPTSAAEPTKTPTAQPRFDFYEILKERKITVPDRSAEIKASIPDDINYFLQAGSFRSDQDANKLRVELLLSNLATNIESSTKNGQTWYRVVTGPFETRSKMAKARSVLASQGVSPLLLKRKKQ